jgi:hypothetical protein
MTLTTAIVLAAANSLLATPTASSALRQPTPAEYRGFILAAGSCEPGQSTCRKSNPKDWTPAEIDTAKRAIDEILATPEGADVVRRAAARGVTVLRRYGVFIGRAGPVSAAAALRRAGMSAAIELYDSFFRNPGGRDSYSGKPGFLLVSAILLHECMHAIDDVSGEPGFLEVAGFIRRGDRWQFALDTAHEAAALTRFNQEFTRFEAAGDFVGGWRLGRAAALNMLPVRVPTIQATVRPAEAFAEIGAILVLDPNARTYLPRALVAYFDANVFRRSPGR